MGKWVSCMERRETNTARVEKNGTKRKAAYPSGALRGAERHGGVVSPLAGFEPEGAAAGQVRNRLEVPWPGKLERGAERIARGAQL